MTVPTLLQQRCIASHRVRQRCRLQTPQPAKYNHSSTLCAAVHNSGDSGPDLVLHLQALHASRCEHQCCHGSHADDNTAPR